MDETPKAPTIFAMASGAGRAAVGVMRLSGPATGRILDALCGPRPLPRRASLRVLRDRHGAELDQALVLWFPGPASYTGEDAGEIHLHGGRAVVTAVAAALLSLGGRPAEAGEFSQRAFLNGRIDLVQAEAIADLVSAETEGQRRQALRQMEGALGRLYDGWALRLRHLLAHQEALIDFPDEDLPPALETAILEEISDLRRQIGGHLDDGRRGERLREGLVFAVTGAPNAGKSSLVNALAGRDVAIVSPVPGTTRDVLEVGLDLAGVPVTLIDTAGLREAEDEIEAEGIRRALARAAAADLVIRVAAADEAEPVIEMADPGVLLVMNKIDHAPARPGWLGVSAATGRGLDALRAALAQEAERLTHREGPPTLTRTRHRAALQDALACLQAAGCGLPELRAEELRLAMRAVGRITGSVGVEDILDTVFRQFCIGK